MSTRPQTETGIKQKKSLPPAGPRKRNPGELEKILDGGLRDSMAVSDPVSTVMPEVREKSGHSSS